MDENQQKAVYKDQQTQDMLNNPVAATQGLSDENRQFMNMVLGLLNEGKIQLYTPSSLLNDDVYNALTDEMKSKADLEAMNLLGAIREMKDLYDANFTETYQMESLVQRLRLTKERFEEAGGDVFLI